MRNLVELQKYGITEKEVESDIDKHLEKVPDETISKLYHESFKDLKVGTIVKGKIINITGDSIIVDLNCKTEGSIPKSDFTVPEELKVGDEIEALLEVINEEDSSLVLSKEKADRMRGWENITKNYKEGDIIKGRVVSLTKGGMMVDIGGIEGLLHISDMSWSRIAHPSEMVAPNQKINVKVLKINKEKGEFSLGMKQLTDNPWEKVGVKYPAAMHLKGKVVNIVPYGAFVELEHGVEGLLHISEMSWTKRLAHPSEMIAIGDIVEVSVLKSEPEKQEISLSMKQLEANPWTEIEQKYPAGTKIQGRVKNVTTYGAFIEIEEGVDGLLHIEDMSWTRKVNKPSDIVKKGDKIEVVILSVDPVKKRVSLGLKQLTPNPWETTIPEKYPEGSTHQAKIIKMSNLGTVVELEPQLEGTLRSVSPTGINSVPILSSGQSAKADETGPSTASLKIDDVVQVQVVKLEPEERRIAVKLA
ncbi:MAG: S1 RNA-binding domain-containing protein [Planctomycetes bacterium]|nr:S1 RNA-binding domain-containing protein [Planctomycetota bacterium]